MIVNKKIFIVIPAHNEAQVIGSVIEGIIKNGYKNIIVVDDGSSDNTEAVAKEHGALVVRHMINRGKGASAKTGIEAAKLLNADVVVTIDGDGQHNPEDIKKLLKKLDRHDLVLGYRLHPESKMPKTRIIGNLFANFFTWIIYGLWVKDSQSGFRAYSEKTLNEINLNYDKYEFDSEIIREIVKNKIKYVEIPIEVRYTKYSMNKQSRQTLVKGIKTIIRLFLLT